MVRWHATLPGVTAEDGSPILLPFVRWAFSLNEGDLLAVSPEEDPAGSWRFLSYGERVWNAADGCLDPWPYIEELLHLPMAAVGPNGVLRLPEEAEALRGGRLQLRVEVDPHARAFTVEPLNDRSIDAEWWLEAHYMLPILPGFQVMLPDDLLWELDLGKGDPLAYKASMALAEYEPWELKKPPEGRSLVELGPGGLLTLPDSLRIPPALEPNAQVRLRVIFQNGFLSNRVTLEVRPWAGL
ncbi:MAG TPA: hypothetical protein VLV54_09625 [Thermoanaerobaculia bacterium]|nr:hypothetical protein [Thermoanaerobaculia bacterium]